VLKVREDIHELSNEELAVSLDELAAEVNEELHAPRTAESLTEAAKRLREKK
jgi:PHD/YefM family antitoxin component YafN of YafNO toxin-antitoxin module